MLLDRFLPDFQFREIHSIEVRAEPPRVFAALKAVAPSELTVSRFLMAVRSVPGGSQVAHEPHAAKPAPC